MAGAGEFESAFPVADLAHWSTSPDERDQPGNAWCGPDCDPARGLHVCPDGPADAGSLAGASLAEAGDEVRVAHYAARMLAGDTFPPIVVIEVADEVAPERKWLVEDGFHRISGALLAGVEVLSAVVLEPLDQP